MIDTMYLAGFAVLAILIAGFVLRLLLHGINIIARPPINPLLFAAAKACAFTSCSFIPLGIAGILPAWFAIPGFMRAIGIGIFFAGIVCAALAMKKLGDDLIFGLPAEGIHALKTDGIFALSRNPLYLGFILIIISSWLCTPNPYNAAAGIIAILLHHRIILKEERYLISQPGLKYTEYMEKTGRYLFVM